MRTLFLLSLLTLSMAAADLAADLKDALTFRATFDGTTDASVALGDKRLFCEHTRQCISRSPGPVPIRDSEAHFSYFRASSDINRAFGDRSAGRSRSSIARIAKGGTYA
jgi:hypothetical protein